VVSQIKPTREELQALVECVGEKAKEEPVVLTGCFEIAELVSQSLDKLHVEHKRVAGSVKTFLRKKEVVHCWVEVGDMVIETNPSQTLGVDPGLLLVMRKAIWQDLLEGKEEPVGFHWAGLTEAGRQFYDKAAGNVVMCFRGKGIGPGRW